MPFENDLPYGKFKKLLLREDLRIEEAKALKSEILKIETQFINKKIPDLEICIEFLQMFLQSRGRLLKKKIHSEVLLSPEKRIYGLPYSVPFILLHWKNNLCNLELIDYNPSALEMAMIQAKGSRYITIDFQSAKSGSLVEDKRDSFEHCLHDLAHAYMFFKDEEIQNKQVQFFQNLVQKYSIFANIMQEDSEFETKFTYCLSDMNSHPEHLKSYLRAILIEVYLKLEKTISNYRRSWIEDIIQY
jgi:hypothetical protein